MADVAVESEFNIDSIITRLMSVGKRCEKKLNEVLSDVELRHLCQKSRDIFLKESSLLELDTPLTVIGDIRGDYHVLQRIFERGGHPPENKYLFLGSYVDTGRHSIQVISLLLAYKIKYPDHTFLLRGNHESASINRIYGFYDECKRLYNVKLWKVFCMCFNCLPIAAVIRRTILAVHGGISPELTSLDQIRQIERPTDIPNTGLLCDLMWADPEKDVLGWGASDRNISYCFGPDKVEECSKNLGLGLIIRSHQGFTSDQQLRSFTDEKSKERRRNQVIEGGYEYFANKKLLTINPRYNILGEYGNKGSYAVIDSDGAVSLQILEEREEI